MQSSLCPNTTGSSGSDAAVQSSSASAAWLASSAIQDCGKGSCSDNVHPTTPKSPQQKNKRRRTQGQEQRRQKEFESAAPQESVWWKSDDARDLFGANDTETMVEALDRRIVLLEKVIVDSSEGWHWLLDNRDMDNRCTICDQTAIMKKAIAVRLALKVAEEKMPLYTWDMVCKEVAGKLKEDHLLERSYCPKHPPKHTNESPC